MYHSIGLTKVYETMSDKLKINLVIAGRSYPLSVKNIKEEEGMRKAATKINQLISVYEQNYAVNDKQDVLAMCALYYASKLEITSIQYDDVNEEAFDKINELTNLLEKHL